MEDRDRQKPSNGHARLTKQYFEIWVFQMMFTADKIPECRISTFNDRSIENIQNESQKGTKSCKNKAKGKTGRSELTSHRCSWSPGRRGEGRGGRQP